MLSGLRKTNRAQDTGRTSLDPGAHRVQKYWRAKNLLAVLEAAIHDSDFRFNHHMLHWQAILHWVMWKFPITVRKKKIQRKKRSTAWWPIGSVRTASERVQKNRHPSERWTGLRVRFSKSAELWTELPVQFSKVRFKLRFWTELRHHY